uniref:Uncharacterized protein n=1 Tax=Timema shepardi TaxID=629360 RepID=A0A7R9AM46_TIMSH|nr:unnamed protein product [Timema shepardi]
MQECVEPAYNISTKAALDAMTYFYKLPAVSLTVCLVLYPHKAPIQDVEDNEGNWKKESTASVDPLSDILRSHGGEAARRWCYITCSVLPTWDLYDDTGVVGTAVVLCGGVGYDGVGGIYRDMRYVFSPMTHMVIAQVEELPAVVLLDSGPGLAAVKAVTIGALSSSHVLPRKLWCQRGLEDMVFTKANSTSEPKMKAVQTMNQISVALM